MTEHERAQHLFARVVVLAGEHRYGVGGADTLIARARVAHHRHHGAGHACVTGAARARQDMREDAFAHDAASEGPAHRLAQAVTVVAAQRKLRRGLVEASCLVDEGYLVERRGGGEVVDLTQAERRRAGLVVVSGTVGRERRVKQCLAVKGYLYVVRVFAGYHHLCLVPFGPDIHLHVEFVGSVVLEVDVDAPLRYVLPSAFHIGGRAVAQHLEPVAGVSRQGAEGDGYGQSHHTCAGYAHTHGVFQDVGAEPCLHVFGRAAQHFGGTGHGERHAHGFGAADGRYDATSHQSYDLFSFFFSEHECVVVVSSGPSSAGRLWASRCTRGRKPDRRPVVRRNPRAGLSLRP